MTGYHRVCHLARDKVFGLWFSVALLVSPFVRGLSVALRIPLSPIGLCLSVALPVSLFVCDPSAFAIRVSALRRLQVIQATLPLTWAETVLSLLASGLLQRKIPNFLRNAQLLRRSVLSLLASLFAGTALQLEFGFFFPRHPVADQVEGPCRFSFSSPPH